MFLHVCFVPFLLFSHIREIVSLMYFRCVCLCMFTFAQLLWSTKKVPWLLYVSLLHIKHGCLVAKTWDIFFLRQQLGLLAHSKDDAFGYFAIVTVGSVACDSLNFLNVFSFLSTWSQRHYYSLTWFLIHDCLPMTFSK